ncbi:MAG: chromate resistance protein [Rhodobacteraceae bacterium]|nr:chromate resistance protein [Paracoccaceae bacterium]
MPGFNTLSVSQLARLVGTPDCPVLIDVRTDADFDAEPRLVPGSVRHRFDLVEELAPGLAGKRAVLLCQRGLKLSEGAAALLRSHGVSAETLDGGTLAWASAAQPMIPAAALPASRLWVTRHRPKIDRIACPWLIRRFVDPGARFLFVAPAEVLAVAETFGAVPFDVEGVTFSHRGERCTFDALLDDFHLHTEALDRLALVVRGADTDRHDIAPQSAGLLAVSVGLSRQYRDDLDQLESGMALYDALYRWARDGFDEGHDWPADRRA